MYPSIKKNISKQLKIRVFKTACLIFCKALEKQLSKDIFWLQQSVEVNTFICQYLLQCLCELSNNNLLQHGCFQHV